MSQHIPHSNGAQPKPNGADPAPSNGDRRKRRPTGKGHVERLSREDRELICGRRFYSTSAYVVEHPALSNDAKLLLIYQLGKPKDWVPTFRDMKQFLRVGRERLQSTLHQLQYYGFLYRRQLGGKGGWEWRWYPHPSLNPHWQGPVLPGVVESTLPC